MVSLRMSDVFISYARSTEAQARQIAKALRALGYGVWRDDELPAHRPYGEVIEERLRAAKAVVVIWSAEAMRSHWVRAEADVAREAGTLVQLRVDGARPPMPFNQIQCADLADWNGDLDAPGWRKVVASIAELAGATTAPPGPAAEPPPPLPAKPSIAVMPFANLSNDPDQEYFADGMMDEIVTALTRNRSIFVIASGSTMTFKGRTVSPQEVAHALGVRYVLEGNVRKAGEHVRIAVKLIDATDGAQMWADRFDDTLEDVFALQDKVALTVAGIIGPAVEAAEIRRVGGRPTDNLGSYDLYLRALPLIRVYRKAEAAQGVTLLERAIALDPNFGAALALAASRIRRSVEYGWSDDPDGDRCRSAELAERALKVGGDDALVLSHVANALLSQDRGMDRAATLVTRAIALNPGHAIVWYVSGLTQLRLGDVDTAEAHFDASVRLDPLSEWGATARSMMPVVRFLQGRFAETVALCGEDTVLFPYIYLFLAAAHGHLGRLTQAAGALARHKTLVARPVEQSARFLCPRPEHRKLLLDGVALAEDKPPSSGTAGVQETLT